MEVEFSFEHGNIAIALDRGQALAVARMISLANRPEYERIAQLISVVRPGLMGRQAHAEVQVYSETVARRKWYADEMPDGGLSFGAAVTLAVSEYDWLSAPLASGQIRELIAFSNAVEVNT